MKKDDDLLIHYDLEEVLKDLTPSEQDYRDFIKLSPSFLGWLLSLRDDQFQEIKENVMVDLEKPPKGWAPLMFMQIEMEARGECMATLEEVKTDQMLKREYVLMIQAVKDGAMEYTPDSEDLLWKFKVTPKGVILLKETGVIKEDDTHGDS